MVTLALCCSITSPMILAAELQHEFAQTSLKHKDSFGKSENLSKIFFAEILVFDHDYEGKSSSSNWFALNLFY